MPRYMLFLHESPENFGALSPDEMMGVIQEYSAWSAALREKGLLAGGEKLTDDMARSCGREARARARFCRTGRTARRRSISGAISRSSRTAMTGPSRSLADVRT